jgi:hypothetical protein
MIDYLGREYRICAICSEVIHERDGAWWDEENISTIGAVNFRFPIAMHVHAPGNWSERPQYKFDSEEAQIFYAWTVDNLQDDELGETTHFGWYALFSEDHAILLIDYQGNVWVNIFENDCDTQEQWSILEQSWQAHNDAIGHSEYLVSPSC